MPSIQHNKINRIFVTFYIESLNFSSLSDLFSRLLKYENRSRISCYYIDSSKPGKILSVILEKIFGLIFKKMSFRLIDIKDEKNELIRIRIARKDLFDFGERIFKGDAYNKLFDASWNKDSLIPFMKKGLLAASISSDSNSVSRMLFIIHVINWHMKKIKIKSSIFIINHRPWINEYRDVAEGYGVTLDVPKKSISIFNFFKLSLNQIIKNNLRLLILFRNLQNHGLVRKNKKIKTDRCFLYLEGRGDINFKNNGHHSDFFWALNSEFDIKNIIYKNFPGEETNLDANGVKYLTERVKYSKSNFLVPIINNMRDFNNESEAIKHQFILYKSIREYWRCLFKTNNIKIYSTWYIYDNDHIAKSEAIKDVGGVSMVQQIAFDGYKTFECSTYADIAFKYSKWVCDNEKGLDSKVNYQIITGYPKDYAAPLLKDEAEKIRAELKRNGAQKIVFIIDENSGYDERWHTGHSLQKENYSFMIEKMLLTPWLGLIFKPKYAKTLRQRIGEDAWGLLEEAKKTGRCHIYLESGRMSTNAPPLLGGLSADLCIHGHMGNAALECSLNNIPTLIIDREGRPHHKFRELSDDKVVFYNWPDTADAAIEYLKDPLKNKDFGNWSHFVDQFDPFRDGKAAYRIGTFKKWILDGYQEKKDKKTIIDDAVNRYAEIWGRDKIIAR